MTLPSDHARSTAPYRDGSLTRSIHINLSLRVELTASRMESSYGVGVKNRFDLFIDDENDPLDVIAETEKRKQQDKAVKKDTKSSKKVNETKTIENVKGSSKNEGDKRDGKPHACVNQQACVRF